MINALQHVGQGVRDIDTTYGFYKRHFGFKVKLNDLTIASREMAAVIGSVETMRMMMAVNAKGGGIIELIEHKSKPIAPFPEEGGYGDFGVLEIGYGVHDIESTVADLERNGLRLLTPICSLDLGSGRRWRYVYLRDPDGLPLQLTEDLPANGSGKRTAGVRGVVHVGIGVSSLERSKEFYGSVLGFDRVLYEHDGPMPEMNAVTGHALPMRMAILERSAPASGPLANLLSRGIVKLFEVPGRKGKHLYEGRCWGDIGCMEVCLDVTDLMATVAAMKEKGMEIYLPPVKIDMGTGSKGLVAYIRDPDGTTIEFVEVKSIAWLPPASFMRTAMPLLRLYDRLA